MLANLINVITAPREAFTSIKAKPTALLPLLLVTAALSSVYFGYFTLADPDFIMEEQLAQMQSFVNVPEGQLREELENNNPLNTAISAVVSIAIMIPLMLALIAGYLSLITKFTHDEIIFKQWFSLSCWASIPALFNALAGWIVILSSSDGRITEDQINPFALNNLLFLGESDFNMMLSTLNLTHIWTLALMTLAYQNWTGRSAGKSAAVICAPYLIIYGIWSLVILL